MSAPAKARESPTWRPCCAIGPPPEASMVLSIVKYGTPVLREKGARVEPSDPGIKKLISDMLETMYAYKGVGLAAQQVGVPVQLTVIDIRGVTDRPSTLEVDGKPVDP